MVARGRWASPVHLLVCSAHRSGWSKDRPVARPDSARWRVMGHPLPKNRGQKERGSLVCSTGDQRHLPAGYAAGPRGAREALRRCRLPRGSEGTKSICCEYSGEQCGETRHRPQCVCDSEVALWSRDCKAVKLLSTQIVRKQAKAISFQTTRKLRATSPSTLPNSTNGWRDWQRRS